MEISRLSPIAATAFEWTLAGGNRAVTVVCKLTFPLEPGTDAPLHAVQEPIALEDRYEGEADRASLVAASDLVPYKAAVDVVLLTGVTPPAAPGTMDPLASARLVVGGDADKIDKTLDLTGHPTGFGPIPPTSPCRAEKLGGAPMLRAGWENAPLPWTIDPAFFNVAPPDQRLKALRPNEAIMLFGLLRDRERFGMRLPGVQPRAFAQNGSEGRDVPLSADTLWIDADRKLLTVTWRGQVPVGSPAQRVVVALQERDAVLTWPELQRRLPAHARGNGAPVSPLPPALPHLPPSPSPSPSPPPPPPTPVPAAVVASAPMPAFVGRRPGPEAPERARSDAAPPSPVPVPARTADPLDLLWFDPAVAPRLRANRAWRRLVDALEQVASDDGAAEGEDRREVFQVLANGEARDLAELHAALATAISPDGKLDPPLVLVAGEATLPFDAAELLRVTLAACKPIAPTDKAFAEVVATVAAMADAAALSDAVAHGLTYRVREAFQQVKHTLPPRYLESTAERALLDGRRYQRREVFGAPHLRTLVAAGSGEPVPAYLPVGVASRLPLFPRFRARLLAELHAQVDHEEAHPCALRVLAVARVVARPGSA